MMTKHTCRECGLPLTDKRPSAMFCTPAHRKTWNNRRMIRGAEIYDLIMAHNYEREKRSVWHTWTHIFNLIRAYRDADKALRNGRKSWDTAEAIARLPMTYSTEGDKR